MAGALSHYERRKYNQEAVSQRDLRARVERLERQLARLREALPSEVERANRRLVKQNAGLRGTVKRLKGTVGVLREAVAERDTALKGAQDQIDRLRTRLLQYQSREYSLPHIGPSGPVE